MILVSIVELAHWFFHSNPVPRKNKYEKSRYWPTGFERYSGTRRTPVRCHRWWCGFGFTLYMSGDYTFVPFTYNRIAFPVADSEILSDNSKAFLNAETVGDTSPVVLFAITFTALFLTTQVLLYISSFCNYLCRYRGKSICGWSRFLVLHKKRPEICFGLQSYLIRDPSS